MTQFFVVHNKCVVWKKGRKGGGSQGRRRGLIAGKRRVEKTIERKCPYMN